METIELEVFPRNEIGTSRSRRLRSQGWIPAVYYRGGSSKPVAIPERSLRALLSQKKKGVTLIHLKGGEFADGAFALLKEIQWHPYKKQVLHVDLHGVDLEEEITVHVPLRFEGQPQGVKQGGVLEILAHELRVKVKVKDIPPFIAVELTPLQLGQVLHVREVQLPEGVRFVGDPDTPIAHVVSPQQEEEETVGVEATAPQPQAEVGKAKEGTTQQAPQKKEKK